MTITPDAIVYWQFGPFAISATLVFTWVVMALLAGGSWLITCRLTGGTSVSRGQLLLEIVLDGIRGQIRGVVDVDADRYLPFIGTLFLFIVTSNVLVVVPGFQAPTGSLSTTTALALCVFVAVPVFGTMSQGLRGYLKTYLQPTWLMLPFNILSELTRTISLSIRLFGNMMSGTMIAAVALAIAPLFFPVIMSVLGLLIGVIQAYIFSVLALVYIVSATRAHEEQLGGPHNDNKGGSTRGEP
ncbi:F0F1 ATP synthase subunit A [Desulfobulbus oligotrophicus]|jgi:F-type H+-transporting ATPase subunit a|uniref:ATP synthase subunit a n=1 Tax=Desulfobulbus oligotrophicus TaxID=1909699 RepID=A0A7T5VBI9_9BACT|nr:F0F1 ATP synthase subunit A [Desulfobulbus oligotrophicus]MCB5285382.1 F0F1 ATP synthase subunit A [Candidatus Cloacimonadota bacterium]MDY0367419.1 F0F1 ATP synthase subunit A [Candidatus Syntrophosphaera sp.]QQG64857.1 F0F1 ATP synthase subunit A [Desulfobulbus oligotrophicus]